MFSLHALVIYSLLTMPTTLHLCGLIAWSEEQQVKAGELTLTNSCPVWPEREELFRKLQFGFLHRSVLPHANVLALADYWQTREGGMCSPRRDMSAAWMYQGSMLLITLQSLQELAIDRCVVHSLPPYHWITACIMLTSIRAVTGSMHIVANG